MSIQICTFADMLLPLMEIDKMYRKVRETRSESVVLLFVFGGGVDALCAGKMLTALLDRDFIEYILVPVHSREEMLGYNPEYFGETWSRICTVFLVDIGGDIDLARHLEAANLTICVFDSYRPIHAANIHSEVLVVDDGEIAQFTQLDGCNSRQWNRISVSSHVYSLCLMLNRGDEEMLWNCIVGMTSVVSHLPHDDPLFCKTYGLLEVEISRASRTSDADVSRRKLDGTIYIDKEHCLVLLRHWTLYDSMLCSPLVQSRLGAQDPVSELNTLLATTGISLAEATQPFAFLDPKVKASLAELLGRPKIDLPGMAFPYFFKIIASQYCFSAYDFVFALSALLTSPFSSPKENFFRTVKSLEGNSTSPGSIHLLFEGIGLAKKLYQSLAKLGGYVCHGKRLKLFKHSYRLLILSPQTITNSLSFPLRRTGRELDDNASAFWWTHIPNLELLARFLQHMVSDTLPLVLVASLSEEKRHLVLGQPHSAYSLASVFEQICIELGAVSHSGGGNCIYLDTEYLSRFLQVLQIKLRTRQ